MNINTLQQSVILMLQEIIVWVGLVGFFFKMTLHKAFQNQGTVALFPPSTH